jgi:acyl dehydratase
VLLRGCVNDELSAGAEEQMGGDIFFEEFEVGAARETTGRTITEADIVLHAGQTGDFYPHHMDAEWCRTQPFGQRMAHGTLVFSVGVGMTGWRDQCAGDELRI